MAKFTRRAARSQLDQRLSDWLDSPQECALRDMARKLALKIDLTPPKTKKKKPGGPPRKLAPDEIAHLQGKYRSALEKDAALKKQEAAFEYLRPLLPRKVSVSPSTLRRRIVLPVLKPSKQPPR
jgi:hypothetical protein